MNSQTVKAAESLVETSLITQMPKSEVKAAAEAEKIVRSWAQRPVAWATHRAINRNNGDWRSYKGVVYAWNDDL